MLSMPLLLNNRFLLALVLFYILWIQTHFEGGGGGGNRDGRIIFVVGLFNLKGRWYQFSIKKTLEYKVVNVPSRISPHKVLQLWLINTVYHLLVKNI